MPRDARFAALSAGALEEAARHRLILIVEDNGTNALILRAMLRKNGFETVVATDGAEGVEMTHSLAPGLVLMDLHMPRLNGFDAAAQILARHRDRAPTLVAVTANANPEVHAACLASGFRCVISKPILLDALIATVREFLPTRFDEPRGSIEAFTPNRNS